MTQFKKSANYPYPIGGCLVPKEFISGVSLSDIEKILGFRPGRLRQGAIIVQLDFLPKIHELEYYGDTRSPVHEFEKNRSKDISKKDLNTAAFAYLQPTTKLLKVIPIDDPHSQKSENQIWPDGIGAMQYKLKDGIRKRATIIDIINEYPYGIFKNT